MLIYDSAYMKLKAKYLVPITSYSVPYRQLQNTNIKKIILNKSKSIDVLNQNQYVFHFDKEYILKGILGDIQLFYIRQILQKRDAELCEDLNISANWNIVSNYYNAFFSASLMLRLCYRGNIFLDNILKKDLERLISNVTGNVINLNSKQFYEINEENEELVLKISPVSEGTHELVWHKMDELIGEMLLLTRKKSDEEFVLESIKKINDGLKNTYPSQLRNRVNYQPLYGLKCVDKKLFSINTNISWIKQLLSFSRTDDDNQISCYMYAYTKYIEYFCKNFIAEYYAIRGRENGIIKHLNQNFKLEMETIKTKYSF